MHDYIIRAQVIQKTNQKISFKNIKNGFKYVTYILICNDKNYYSQVLKCYNMSFYVYVCFI